MGNRGFELGQRSSNAIHGINDIGVRLAEEDNQYGGFSVRVARVQSVFLGVQCPAHIRDSDWRSIVIGHNQRFVINRLEDLIIGANFPGLVAIGKVTFGDVRVCGAQNASDLLESDAILIQCHGVQLNANRRKRASAHNHLTHTVHLRQLLRQD